MHEQIIMRDVGYNLIYHFYLWLKDTFEEEKKQFRSVHCKLSGGLKNVK